MKKIHLTSSIQLEEVLYESKSELVVIFKHSTRCSISSMALNRIERGWDLDNVKFYYLDLLEYRYLSNEVSERLGIIHEAPQLIALENGAIIYSSSHNAISLEDLKQVLQSN